MTLDNKESTNAGCIRSYAGCIRAFAGRARSNDLTEEFPPWLAPWLAPWLTKISMNFINVAHKQINVCATIHILYPGLRS